jgi:hypothetical protein
MNPRTGARRFGIAAAALAILIGTLAVPSAAFAATPATDGVSTLSCPGAWPAAVQGTPTILAGSPAGDHLYHDRTGWHLRMTHRGSWALAYGGTIRANKPIHVRGFRLEAGDTFALSADKMTLTYRFRNYGRLDGLDFVTECATRLGIAGSAFGRLLPPRQIWLGAFGVHPIQNPVEILKRV